MNRYCLHRDLTILPYRTERKSAIKLLLCTFPASPSGEVPSVSEAEGFLFLCNFQICSFIVYYIAPACFLANDLCTYFQTDLLSFTHGSEIALQQSVVSVNIKSHSPTVSRSCVFYPLFFTPKSAIGLCTSRKYCLLK